jgi:hypothetical protein
MTAHRGRFVGYFRVSTDKQGRSGLGLDAQRKAVLDYLNGGTWLLVESFTEVETGKRNERPELEQALAACKRHKAQTGDCQARPPVSHSRFHRNAHGFRRTECASGEARGCEGLR